MERSKRAGERVVTMRKGGKARKAASDERRRTERSRNADTNARRKRELRQIKRTETRETVHERGRESAGTWIREKKTGRETEKRRDEE